MARRVGRNRDRSFLRRRGLPCLWQRAILEPSFATDGAMEYGGLSFQDRGLHYVESKAYKGRNTSFMFTSDSKDVPFTVEGSLETGTCTCTVAAHIPVGNQDRIILQDKHRVSSVLVERAGSGRIDSLDLRFVQELLDVRADGRSYLPDSDVKLIKNNDTGICRLEWQQGVVAPEAGVEYTVNVMAWPVWIVTGKPMSRNFGGGDKNKLPYRCNLALDDERLRAG